MQNTEGDEWDEEEQTRLVCVFENNGREGSRGSERKVCLKGQDVLKSQGLFKGSLKISIT